MNQFLMSFLGGQLPCLHPIVERRDEIRQLFKEKLFFSELIIREAYDVPLSVLA
jgi:hypothetical protein